MQTAVVLGGLVALAVHLGSTAVLDALGGLDAVTLLGALVIGALTTATSAGRWCLVARALGTPLRARRAVADVYRATLLNSLLPAGVLGDLQRVVSHGRRGGRAVVLERVAGQAVVVVGATALLVVAPPPGLLGSVVPAAGTVLAIALVIAVVALLVLTTRRAARVRASVLGVTREVRRGVLTRRTAPAVIGLSLVGLAGHLALFVLAARAAGATLPTVALLGVLVPALLAMSVPLNVAGFGPREAVAAATFAGVGSGAATGFATGVVFGVLALVSCLPGALVLIADLRFARQRVVDGPAAHPGPCDPVDDGDHRGAGHQGVRRGHGVVVGAGPRDGRQVAGADVPRQRGVASRSVAGLAVPAHHGDRRRGGGAGPTDEVRVVPRPVQRGARVVAHAAVHDDDAAA